MTKPCKKCGSLDRRPNGNCRPCNTESARQWRAKNRARIQIYNKTRNATTWTKTKNRVRATEWTKNNPASVHNKRAKSLGVEGTFTNDEWKSLCLKTGKKCLKCKDDKSTLTVDHVIPLSKGGTNYIENIQPLCKKCNSQKHTESIDYRPGQNDNPQEQLTIKLE
jgi:5-methylcytosine-specific restriction endonuclease McrA